MDFKSFPKVYTHDLYLNLEVLQHYDIDAKLMHGWNKTEISNLTECFFPVTYDLNDNPYIDKDIAIIIDKVMNRDIGDESKYELRNSLMYFCFKAEQALLSTIFNDKDYLQLKKVGDKIIKIQEKPYIELTLNRIEIGDKDIATKIIDYSLDLLLQKFKKWAKHTKFRNVKSIDDIIEFTNDFRKANESVHLAILGQYANTIHTYLHNENLLLSVDNTKLNLERKAEFPLTNKQSDLIYELFELLNLLTPRKKGMSVNTNLYIRNCIDKFLTKCNDGA